MKKLLILLLLLIFNLSLYATNYYISVSGSDSNNGSSSSPWKTLNYACSKATQSGDVINVGAGIFNVSSQCSLAAGVSIVGQGISTTTLNCTYTTGTWYNGHIINLVSSSQGTNGNQSISYLTMSGGSGINSEVAWEAILCRKS